MPHKTKGTAIFDNLVIGDRAVEGPTLYDPASSIAEYARKAGVFMLEEVLFRNDSLTVVDSGGATGGWIAEKIFENLVTPYTLVVASLEVEVISVAAGISATGTVNFGIGTAAATTGSFSGTAADLCIANAIALTAGAGGPTKVIGPPIIATITSPGDIYFNIGVADADITADAAVVLNATYRGYFLEM